MFNYWTHFSQTFTLHCCSF